MHWPTLIWKVTVTETIVTAGWAWFLWFQTVHFICLRFQCLFQICPCCCERRTNCFGSFLRRWNWSRGETCSYKTLFFPFQFFLLSFFLCSFQKWFIWYLIPWVQFANAIGSVMVHFWCPVCIQDTILVIWQMLRIHCLFGFDWSITFAFPPLSWLFCLHSSIQTPVPLEGIISRCVH